MKKRLTLYQYVILHHPEEGKTALIQEPKSMLAENDKAVAMKAAREVPEDLLEDLSNIEIIVRPF